MKDQKPKISITSFGCQMNQYDTEVAEGFLEAAGYEVVDPRSSLPRAGIPACAGRTRDGDDRADIILMNTCSVRDHAEQRVFGRLGMLGKIKKERPELIVGLMGCMVEEHGERLFQRFPQLDFMIGTRNIKDLPGVIERVRQGRGRVASIKREGISIEYTDLIKRRGNFHAWLPIMTGCNKVCTFCIVPITRGAEVSMSAREVYREASRLVSEGVKWITLLGQNVNSYRGEDSLVIASLPATNLGGRAKQSQIASSALELPRNDGQSITFPILLQMLCQIEGLERISFTTSHPQDATEELFKVIARNPKISRRFHLPLQSGSNRILKRMKRLHTYEEYKAKIDLMRTMIPEISLTTDMIVGFSGETDSDFQMTRRALQDIRYDGAYLYKYSARPSTPASRLPDDVLPQLKESRHAELLSLQKQISYENNLKWLGKTVEVFLEEANPRNESELLGRTDREKKVVVKSGREQLGSLQKVRLQRLAGETFLGSLLVEGRGHTAPQ